MTVFSRLQSLPAPTKSRSHVRTFKCVGCGSEEERDCNASVNLECCPAAG
ncbi:zinc ribbon domain-containing protein [Kamptonema formosum]